MRPIDADEAKKLERMFTLKPSERMLFRLMLDRMPTYEPPNDPLTLEELREMDGEPVWAEVLDGGKSRYAFVDAGCELIRFFTTRRGVACECIGRYFKTYGKTWLAYHRKPEEAE